MMRNEDRVVIHTSDGPQVIVDYATAVATMSSMEPGEVWFTPADTNWERRMALKIEAERIRAEDRERPE